MRNPYRARSRQSRKVEMPGAFLVERSAEGGGPLALRPNLVPYPKRLFRMRSLLLSRTRAVQGRAMLWLING